MTTLWPETLPEDANTFCGRKTINCHYNALVEDATTGHWCLVDSKDAGVVPLDTTAALKLLRDAVSGPVVAPVGQRKVRGWIAPVDELFRESVEMAAHAAAAT